MGARLSVIYRRGAAFVAFTGRTNLWAGTQVGTTPDPQRARSADQVEDQAWSALHDWLVGWSKVPNATANQARAIHDTLFPAGLKFTRLPYKLEWAEADARLARITTDKLDTQIEQLGGKPILDQLRAAHQAYGEALGITIETQDNSVGLREPLNQFTAALRAYVLAVAAHADPDDAEGKSRT